MQGSQPLVSVVIPCFDASVQHLKEALASVAAQTYEPIEVLLVDDGSTDPPLLDYLGQLRSEGLVTILRQDNQGPAAARNTAVRASSGTYVLPVDADDRITADYVEEAVTYLEGHPETPMVYGEAEYFGARSGRMEVGPYSERTILTDNMIFNSCVYRRAAFDRVGGYNPRMRFGLEDHEFWLRLCAETGPPHKLSQTVLYYRIRESSRNAAMIDDRAQWVASMAEIFRVNHALYARHPDVLFQVIADTRDELEYWKGRYWRLDALVRRLPAAESVAGRLRRGPLRRWL